MYFVNVEYVFDLHNREICIMVLGNLGLVIMYFVNVEYVFFLHNREIFILVLSNLGLVFSKLI